MFSRLSQRPELIDFNYGGINYKSAKLELMEELSHMTPSPSAILNLIFFFAVQRQPPIGLTQDTGPIAHQ